MDAGDWITLAGVVVAVAAAVFAFLQVRRAKEQVQFARDQAWSARESARLADVSAKAAVDQADSARESNELTRAIAHRADQPRFELIEHAFAGGDLHIHARLVQGPPEVRVSGRWSAISSGPGHDDENLDAMVVDLDRETDVVLGGFVWITAEIPEWATAATVRTDFTCRGVRDDTREWRAPATLEWRRPVPPRIY